MDKKFKQDKGVAGLTILLSLVVMLFVIGLLVMIFSIMGAKLQTSTYDTTTATITNETVTGFAVAGDLLAVSDLRDVVCTGVALLNWSSNSSIPTTNYTLSSDCNLSAIASGNAFLGYNVKVTYSYTYEADNSATDVMNETNTSLASTVDWFDIFITIGSMVVLILLVVIIITAIRSSGMIAGGETANPNSVGSA